MLTAIAKRATSLEGGRAGFGRHPFGCVTSCVREKIKLLWRDTSVPRGTSIGFASVAETSRGRWVAGTVWRESAARLSHVVQLRAYDKH